MTFQTMPPTLNLGSFTLPATGRMMSITPERSVSSATASSTGNWVALGDTTRSPKVNWVRRTWLLASSLPSASIL